MSATLKFDMTRFNSEVARVQEMLGRNAGSYVRTTARRVIRRMAWNAPKAPGYMKASGRLRAGFWPAATALGVGNIYTPQADKGEGSARDMTHGDNPRFVIENAVPYVMRLKVGLEWVEKAIQGVEAQMERDLRKYCEDTWARRALIDDLSAE